MAPRLSPLPSGFTLLETLIAFVIAAGAGVALFGAVSTGLRATGQADHTGAAWERARSRMAAQSVSLKPGDSAGDDGGGFAWRVSVRQRQDAPLTGSPRTLRLFTVAVTISWTADGGERRVQLVSDRLAVGP